MSSAGTKVTKDPAARRPIEESTGVITSDSLAAESLNSGGSFASGHAGISGQPSKGSTAANEDTSSAIKLDAASDAEARQATEEWNESAQLNAGRGLGKEAGRGPTYDLRGSHGGQGNSGQGNGAGDEESSSGAGAGGNGNTKGVYSTVHGTGSAHTAGVAPTAYSANVDPSTQKPHGRNIQEGGFDADASNTSYTEIGSEQDPGRVAEQEFQRRDARAAGSTGGGESEITGDGQYDSLKEEAA